MTNDDKTLYGRHEDEMDDFGDGDYGSAVPEDHFDEEEEESLVDISYITAPSEKMSVR